MSTFPPPIALTGDPSERNAKSPNIHLGSLTSVTLYHDYLCPWCYVVWFQAKKLREEFGLAFDWRAAELYPPSLPRNPRPAQPVDPNAPKPPPSRFDLFAEAEGVTMPAQRPSFVLMRNALLATEFALIEHGYETGERFIGEVYRAYWERLEDISDVAVLARLAENVGIPGAALTESVQAERYVENILEFDDDAYATGIRHVPTFIFGAEERLAEAPYTSLAAAAERFLIRAEKHRKKG